MDADRAHVRVVPLKSAPGERASWGRSKSLVFAWAAIELLFVTNPWQISSRIRVGALRLFGAEIGRRVVFRPRTRVRFPWNLQVGNDCWIGEGVWFHNQDQITVGSDVVISQESFLTTGSHAHRRDMALITSPIQVEDGAWVTARCIILGGTTISTSALVTPGSVLRGTTIDGGVYSGNPANLAGMRFP
jgi:putative colanic acid biosynthesis acetyltransferase WcaF